MAAIPRRPVSELPGSNGDTTQPTVLDDLISAFLDTRFRHCNFDGDLMQLIALVEIRKRNRIRNGTPYFLASKTVTHCPLSPESEGIQETAVKERANEPTRVMEEEDESRQDAVQSV